MNKNHKVVIMNMDISWKLASKGGKTDPKIGVTSYSENIYIAVHIMQTRYSGMQISIKYFYKKCGTDIPDCITPGLIIHCKGLKHKGINLVQYIGLNVYKGNKGISFEVYKFIINKLFDTEMRNTYLQTYIFVLDS